MTALLIIGPLVYLLVVLFVVSLCMVAKRSDRQASAALDGWRNEPKP